MTLLEMIKANREARDGRPKRQLEPYLCPASMTACSQRCYLRHQCAAKPNEIQVLTERLNDQTEHAMVEYVQKLRRG